MNLNLEDARFNMIEQQIRPWNVLDPSVLDSLQSLRREDFVPAGQRELAFADIEIPLGDGQFMLAPKLEARLLQSAMLQESDRILEIGSGSGYMAALLAHQGGSVTSVEINPRLAAMARNNLQKAGINRVDLHEGNGLDGIPAPSSYDVIILSGSVQNIAPALLQQLKPGGGRMVAIVGTAPVMQAQLVLCDNDSVYSYHNLFETTAPMLVGGEQKGEFVL